MKKVLSIDQVRQADAYTIKNEPVASVDLMERAAKGCYHWFRENMAHDSRYVIFCGQGNNGGDGLVIARLLAEDGNYPMVYCVEHSRTSSDDFSINLQRLKEQARVKVHFIRESTPPLVLEPGTVVIDALLGSGITKAVEGLLSTVINQINASRCKVISIDIPSGMYCDKPSEPTKGPIVRATYTLTFEVPKLAFFWPENETYLGDWSLIKIGLHEDYIDQLKTSHFFTEKQDIAQILHPRMRFSHKGNFGHGLLISGSYGKMGAAVLGAKAALRAGAGLITAHIPGKGYSIIQTSVPEAMTSIDPSGDVLSTLPDLSGYDSIAIGPGIGTGPQTANTFKLLIQNTTVPLLIDADAINILAENKTWCAFLPPRTILTPHFKEFERITTKADNSFERNKLQLEFSVKYGVYVVLKGAYTCISSPDGNCYFNPTGNPGMATAGSGDTLTGIILGFLAQGYTPGEACLTATYLHGMAGDLAASKIGQESLIASDIIDYLPYAFQYFKLKET